MQIEELVSAQRAFFNTGATKDAAFRRRALAALRQAVTAREADICAALKEVPHTRFAGQKNNLYNGKG